MKAMYGNVPVKSLHITKHDVSTNDATLQASDMQAGITAYARGQKITGTGKCFEFAMYGKFNTNLPIYIPNQINVIEIASVEYPIRSVISFDNMNNTDFSSVQTIGVISINGANVEIQAVVENNMFLKLICESTVSLEVFYGKDNYV